MSVFAAFFDWDGTLSGDGATMSPAVMEAIHAFRRDGNLAFLCTGRASGVIPPPPPGIGFDGLVAAAGAFVRYKGQMLNRQFIPAEDVDRLIAHFLADGQTCVMEGEQGMYVVGGEAPDDWPRITSPEEFGRLYPGHIISKLTLRGPMSPATDAMLSPVYAIIRHGDYEEIMPAGCSKAAGMRLVLEAAGIPAENCWAFGDSYNDIDMLEAAGIGVAMGNAPDAVKAAADRVTEPVSRDGVARALEALRQAL